MANVIFAIALGLGVLAAVLVLNLTLERS